MNSTIILILKYVLLFLIALRFAGAIIITAKSVICKNHIVTFGFRDNDETSNNIIKNIIVVFASILTFTGSFGFVIIMFTIFGFITVIFVYKIDYLVFGHGVLALLTFIMKICFAVILDVVSNSMEAIIAERLRSKFETVKKKNEPIFSGSDERTFVTVVQQKLECCGLTGPTFWDNNIPHDCCKLPNVVDMRTIGKCNKTAAFTKGCSVDYDVAISSILFMRNTFITISIVAVLSGVVGLILVYLVRRHQAGNSESTSSASDY